MRPGPPTAITQREHQMATATQHTPTQWTGHVEIRTILFPTGKFTANGKEILRKSTLTKIFLRHPRQGEIPFNVTHRNGFTSITDHRMAETGQAGTTGIWGTRERAAKGGKVESFTPSGWAHEVERYVGWSEAIALLMEAGCEMN